MPRHAIYRTQWGSMKKFLALVALLIVLSACLIAFAASSSAGVGGSVYSLAGVQAGIAHAPAVWSGRTLRIAGRLRAAYADEMCAPRAAYCDTRKHYLFDVAADAPAGTSIGGGLTLVDAGIAPQAPNPELTLLVGTPDPLLSRLRQIPLLKSLLPQPQAMRFGKGAVYRVRVERVPTTSMSALCTRVRAQHSQQCFNLVLLDADPARR